MHGTQKKKCFEFEDLTIKEAKCHLVSGRKNRLQLVNVVLTLKKIDFHAKEKYFCYFVPLKINGVQANQKLAK